MLKETLQNTLPKHRWPVFEAFREGGQRMVLSLNFSPGKPSSNSYPDLRPQASTPPCWDPAICSLHPASRPAERFRIWG